MQTPEQWPGVNGVATYSEKLEIGYRWFDATNTTPLFPFGVFLRFNAFASLLLDLSVSIYREHHRQLYFRARSKLYHLFLR